MSDSAPLLRSQVNSSPPVVRADELYLWSELVRRLRWKRHSARQAQRLGLRPIKFGSRLYIHGSTVLAWFAGQQEVPHD
jgi:hypothetical protein